MVIHGRPRTWPVLATDFDVQFRVVDVDNLKGAIAVPWCFEIELPIEASPVGSWPAGLDASVFDRKLAGSSPRHRMSCSWEPGSPGSQQASFSPAHDAYLVFCFSVS